MKILVISACTGKKAIEHARGLTLSDFQAGQAVKRARERRLPHLAAEQLYIGEQHRRLMRGVELARRSGVTVHFKIVSAGYGLVDATDRLAPYDVTFTGMSAARRREWGRALGLPTTVRAALAEQWDLALVALGATYLDACRLLDRPLELKSVVHMLTGGRMAERLRSKHPSLRLLPLHENHTRIFGAGLVGIKGEVAARILQGVAAPGWLEEFKQARNPLDMLAKGQEEG